LEFFSRQILVSRIWGFVSPQNNKKKTSKRLILFAFTLKNAFSSKRTSETEIQEIFTENLKQNFWK